VNAFKVFTRVNLRKFFKMSAIVQILNVFRVSLRKDFKKHRLIVNFEVIFDIFQSTYLR
jgi:hypothetical protein